MIIDAETIDSTERAVLGAALRDAAIREHLSAAATPEWFVALQHRTLFIALQRVTLAHQPLDIPTIVAASRKDALSTTDAPLDLDWLRESWKIGATLSPESVEKTHIPELRRSYQTRALQSLAGALVEQCESSEPGIVAAWLAGRAEAIMRTSEVSAIVNDAEALMNIESVQDVLEFGPLSGIGELDKSDFRFGPGKVTIIAARPGNGKSACARQMAISAASQGVGVVFVAAEEGMAGWKDTRIAMLTGETRLSLAMNTMSRRGREIHSRFVNDAYERALYVVDNVPSLSAYDVVAAVRRHKRQDPSVGVVFVDQMQALAGWNDARRGEGRDQGPIRIVDEIVRGCKELGVHAVLIQQLSRDVDKGTKRREPRASDLATTAFFEHVADAILFVHRENYEPDEDTPDAEDTTAILKWGKLRGGKKTRHRVPWDGPRVRIGTWVDPIADAIEKDIARRGESVPFGDRS